MSSFLTNAEASLAQATKPSGCTSAALNRGRPSFQYSKRFSALNPWGFQCRGACSDFVPAKIFGPLTATIFLAFRRKESTLSNVARSLRLPCRSLFSVGSRAKIRYSKHRHEFAVENSHVVVNVLNTAFGRGADCVRPSLRQSFRCPMVGNRQLTEISMTTYSWTGAAGTEDFSTPNNWLVASP